MSIKETNPTLSEGSHLRSALDTDSAIVRLRGSRLNLVQVKSKAEVKHGLDDGKAWASTRASYDQLRRLSQLYDEWPIDAFESEDDDYLWSGFKSAIDPDDCVYNRELAEALFGSWQVDVAYLYGFVQGAAELFNQIEDEL